MRSPPPLDGPLGAALAKAYGREYQPQPSNLTDDLPPLPPPRIQRAVDREMAACDFWLKSGRLALGRHPRHHPHAVLSFSRIASWLEIAMALRLTACGLDSKLPEAALSDDEAAGRDLKRAYGHPCAD